MIDILEDKAGLFARSNKRAPSQQSWKGKKGTKYNFNSPIPRTRAENIFRDQVPMHGINLLLMLLPRLDGKLIKSYIKKFDGPITSGDHDLILVDFRPGDIVECILRVEPACPFN